MTMTSGKRAPRPMRSLESRLRPSAKVLPEHARAHNRSLVLQQLFHSGPTSRAAIARATGLTRVTVSDLVSVLISEGLVEELGIHSDGRVGKPATMVGMRTEAFRIVVVDLADGARMRGAVVTLTGEFEVRETLDIEGRTGTDMVDLLTRFCRSLVAQATAPVMGVGIGSPGVIDATGRVIDAPNRRWFDVPLAELLSSSLGLPVHVANDANTATLGEFTFGGAEENGLMVLTIGEGVGAGIMVDGALVRGVGNAAGEIGHVRVVDDGALRCACGRDGCLETILSVPALRRSIEGRTPQDSEAILASVGRSLGTLLAPVVSALNLVEVLISGPSELLEGPLQDAALATVRERTMTAISDPVVMRMSALDEDVVLYGAAVLVLSGQLGVS